MIIFGKPGAGKGTLSAQLVNNYDVSFVSCGDLLRKHISDRTKVGVEVERVMANGDLVSDDLITNIVTQKLDILEKRHWILDGFPRTRTQGVMLDSHLERAQRPLSLVVELDVDDDVILRRISGRWIHPISGRVYNSTYNKPLVPGKDDVTGEPLVQRPDDKPEVFSRRLENYYASTQPLMNYFRGKSSNNFRVVSLKGETSDEIWPQLVSTINEWFPLVQKRALQANQVID